MALKQFVEMIENMVDVDYDNAPAILLLADVYAALIAEGVTVEAASAIVGSAEVRVQSYDREDPLWQRLLVAYPRLVKATLDATTKRCGPLAAAEMVKNFTLKLNF